MKQFNRKPLFLGLALTLAAPIAFAQTTYPQSSTQSTDAQATTQSTQPTQDTQSTTQSQSTTTQPTTAGTQADTQSTTQATTDTQSSAGAEAMAGTSTTGAQKRNWSDLDLDKNGSLSSTEAAPVSSLSQSFTTADANADGELTQDEYKAFLASNGKDKAPGSDK